MIQNARIAKTETKLGKLLHFVKKITGAMTDGDRKQVSKKLTSIKKDVEKPKFELNDEQRVHFRTKVKEIKKEIVVREIRNFKKQASVALGSPIVGLKAAEYRGLVGLGYTDKRIKRMGVDAAKAAFWNHIKAEESGMSEITEQLNDILSAIKYSAPKI
jgi:hypothetical protein